MIIVDTALERRELEGNPVRVAMVGAGFMARGIALQMLTASRGMRLVAIANRTVDKAERAYREAGAEAVSTVSTLEELERAIREQRYAVTADPLLLTAAEGVDVILEVTGDVEYSAHVAVSAIDHGKHLVLMNAELDSTVGPLLKVRADRAGVVVTNSDGDQPGVIMNLYRFVRSIGLRPVLAGNVKGLQDVRRTPETQAAFAAKYGQNPRMVTSFADGTKVSFEMAVVANGTGLRSGRRGMYGPRAEHVNDSPGLFPMEQMLNGGLVDYVLGAQPGPGVFVLGHMDHPIQQHYLELYKLGDGPLYTFYTPYHLCHFEAPLTAARAALFQDAALTPLGAPVCDVIATAKRDLRAGEVLDGIGGFDSYGELENADVVRDERLLPMGLAGGCRLVRDIPMDRALTYDDVELPEGRLSDQLRAEQEAYFADAAGQPSGPLAEAATR
jgi:predicted homoserine dehydrogenase-like protein